MCVCVCVGVGGGVGVGANASTQSSGSCALIVVQFPIPCFMRPTICVQSHITECPHMYIPVYMFWLCTTWQTRTKQFSMNTLTAACLCEAGGKWWVWGGRRLSNWTMFFEGNLLWSDVVWTAVQNALKQQVLFCQIYSIFQSKELCILHVINMYFCTG